MISYTVYKGADVEKKLMFHFLGTAAGEICSQFSNSASVLETDETAVLVDAGDGAYTSMIRQGIPKGKLKAILISHRHGDHILGLTSFGMFNPEVFLPVSEKYSSGYQPFFPKPIRRLSAGETYQVEDIEIRTTENAHLRAHQTPEENENSIAFSFEFFHEGKRVVFSGDLGTLANEKNFWKLLDTPCDLLVLEAAHIQPIDRLIQHLKGKKIGVLVFNHVWRLMLTDEEIRNHVESALQIPVFVAKDGDWITLCNGTFRYGSRKELPSALHDIHYYTPEEKKVKFLQEGIPFEWKIIGQFPNPKINGEYTGMISEQAQELLKDALNDCSGSYTDCYGHSVSWRKLGPDEMTPLGLIPFAFIYCGSEIMNCAVTEIMIPAAGKYTFLWGSDDGCRIFVDECEIAYDPFKRAAVKDQHRKEVFLTAGKHKIILFHDTRMGGYGIYFRISQLSGDRRTLEKPE